VWRDRALNSKFCLLNLDDRPLNSNDRALNSKLRPPDSNDRALNLKLRPLNSDDRALNSKLRPPNSDDRALNSNFGLLERSTKNFSRSLAGWDIKDTELGVNCPMVDPATFTATAIAKLAFDEFIKSGAGELAKKSIGGAIDQVKHLRDRIQG
jgi:hypothetical protein